MPTTMMQGIATLTAAEAASLIQHGQTVGFSGFTSAGAPKAIPEEIGRIAEQEHDAGRPYQIGVLTGASTSDKLDGALARANAISFRTPYQADPTLRKQINAGETHFFDMHLSMLPQAVRYGHLGPLDWAVVEAADITPEGGIVLTSSVGASPTFCTKADKIIVELNHFHPFALRGLHDIYEPADPPHRLPIPIYKPSDRIGSSIIRVNPEKIVGIVECEIEDKVRPFPEPDELTKKIGYNVAEFLAAEKKAGRIPDTFLPLQSGVGDTANAVLGALGDHPEIPPFEMYTEVVQDSVARLIMDGRITFASTCSFTFSSLMLREVYANLSWFRNKLIMRPQEISNNPEVIRRLGVVSINTAIEVDVFGNVNSTHVMGKQLMNGIGGSGDFTRNAYLSIFTCPSTAKGGKISTIVPLVSHLDHSEHSVQIIVTEQGVADLRGKDPHQRAELIVRNCAHPDFRDELYKYLEAVEGAGHAPFALGGAFAMHQQFLSTGDMRGVDWSKVSHKL